MRFHNKLNPRGLLIAVISCMALAFFCVLIMDNRNYRTRKISPKLRTTVTENEKVVIGIVSCRKPNDTGSNIESSVLMKSVVISAKMYSVKRLEFHLFLEYKDDEMFFIQQVESYGVPTEVVDIQLYFYSAVDIVPQKFQDWMIYHKKFRCGFSRLFFPTALQTVDSILYLDTDFIVTGNIMELWKHLQKMSEQEMVGVVANNQPDSYPVNYKMHNCFPETPFITPKGLNSGLILMNLTRMREHSWTDWASTHYEKYSKIARVDDQALLNIILHFEPEWLHVLPCQFNIRCSPCDHGFICKDVDKDPYGIQLIHGADNQFSKGRRFYHVYEAYRNFDMRTHKLVKNLIMPIKLEKEPKSKTGDQKCDSPVNPYLFVNIISKF